MAKPRLDQILVSTGAYASRARARDAILRGRICLNGKPLMKPGATLATGDAGRLVIDDPARGYVSRAALKLLAGLNRFGFEAEGRVALDLGASTGGFTQVLLERGAKSVYALDVGHSQMAPDLGSDPRVENLEGRNARDIVAGDFAETPSMLTCDVSFISLKLALPAALEIVRPTENHPAWAILLVKPQFEVGREGIGKGGLVKDLEAGRDAAHDIADWLAGRSGWTIEGLVPSPVKGGDGNIEYLLGAHCD